MPQYNKHTQAEKKRELNNIVITERKINEIINVLIQSQDKFLAKLFQSVTVRQLDCRSTVLFEHTRIDDFLKHKRKKTNNPANTPREFHVRFRWKSGGEITWQK